MNAIVPNTPQPDKFRTFIFGDITIRVILNDDGDPLFIGADVCRALDLSNTSAALSSLDDDQKGIINPETPYNSQGILYVTESGLYSLIFKSKKDAAKKFQRWVTDDVLPQIRKTGSYIAKQMSPSELFALQVQVNLEYERRMAAIEQRQNELAAQVGAKNEYFTVYAYCRLKGIPTPNASNANLYGRRCSEYSRKAGISIDKITDQRHGYINTYRLDVLEAILLPPMLRG